MIKAIELAHFAEKNGWIAIDKGDSKDSSYIRYLTPSGQRILVEFSEDGSIYRVYP